MRYPPMAPAKLRPAVCIVEPSDSHDNDVFAQIELLREHCEVHIVIPECILERDLFRQTSSLYRVQPLKEQPRSSRLKRLALLPAKYWRIKRYCQEIRSAAIIFNTIYTPADLNLIGALFPRNLSFQVIHNYQRFLKPWMRRYLARFSGNFVLSEEVFEHIQKTHPPAINLGFFLPIFFESFRKTCRGRSAPWKDGCATFNLGVFGGVDQARRNYQGLIESVRRFKASGKPVNFRLHLVGTAPASFVHMLHEAKLTDVVSVYGFTSYADMFALVEHMDIVLFLIDSQVTGHNLYNRYKVTGTSVMLKAFHKVGASSDEFPVDKLLADTTYFYPGQDLGVLFKQIALGEIGKDQIRAREARYKDKSLLTFENQQTRLLSALRISTGAVAGK